MAINKANVIVKSNAHYTCQECASTEKIQAHHQIPQDDNSLICLCAECHSKRHPSIPHGLFINKNTQPYWENKSASTLAKELCVHPRTIYRIAKKLSIPKGILTIGAETAITNLFRIYNHNKYKSPEFRIKELKCKRCGWQWIPRKVDVRLCPNCKTAYWDEEKQRKLTYSKE